MLEKYAKNTRKILCDYNTVLIPCVCKFVFEIMFFSIFAPLLVSWSKLSHPQESKYLEDIYISNIYINYINIFKIFILELEENLEVI